MAIPWPHLFDNDVYAPGAPQGSGDRARSYGDGLFETLPVVDDHPLFWAEHLQRLQAGADILGIESPGSELWWARWRRLLAAAPEHRPRRYVLKLLLWRRDGQGYRTPIRSVGHVLLQILDWPERPVEYWESGIRAGHCPVALQTGAPYLRVKTLNRLNQIMAWRACPADWQEAVLCDGEGNLREGIQSNVFWREGRRLYTPQLADGGIPGIQLQIIADFLRGQGWAWEVVCRPASALATAEEIFFCNSLIGAWPVRHWDARLLPGAQGELAQGLATWHRGFGLGPSGP